MRIATSTIYNDQTASIDGLSAQYQSIGQDLSTGKSLNVPSDDPAQISQDLTLTNTINQENGDASNAVGAQNELTFTDSTLASLTGLLQTARSLAVEGATDIIPNGAQRPLIGKQISGLLNQALALANQKYGNTYIFAGTGSANTPPITPLGSPVNSVAFGGNNQARTELINGQQVQVGTTMQAAFNQGSTNGTPSVFTMLATLQNTLDQEPASIQSQRPITVSNDTITGAADATQTTLGQIAGPPAPMTTVPLTADSTGQYSIEIDGTNTVTAAPGKAVFTFHRRHRRRRRDARQRGRPDQRANHHDRRDRKLERRLAAAATHERRQRQPAVFDQRRAERGCHEHLDLPCGLPDPQPSKCDEQPIDADRRYRRCDQPGALGAGTNRSADSEPGRNLVSTSSAFER